jgi:hypothetical protein
MPPQIFRYVRSSKQLTSGTYGIIFMTAVKLPLGHYPFLRDATTPPYLSKCTATQPKTHLFYLLSVSELRAQEVSSAGFEVPGVSASGDRTP